MCIITLPGSSGRQGRALLTQGRNNGKPVKMDARQVQPLYSGRQGCATESDRFL